MLADLKFLSCNTSCYPHNPHAQTRAVDRRSKSLAAEYARKARSVDIQYGGVVQGVVGPVLKHLQTYGEVKGYVVGRWGEMSEDLHSLVHDLAAGRLQVLECLPGRSVGGRGRELSREGQLAIFTGSIRRQLSFVAVRIQARLLIDRLEGLVSDGATAAASQRTAAVQSEWILANESASC